MKKYIMVAGICIAAVAFTACGGSDVADVDTVNVDTSVQVEVDEVQVDEAELALIEADLMADEEIGDYMAEIVESAQDENAGIIVTGNNPVEMLGFREYTELYHYDFDFGFWQPLWHDNYPLSNDYNQESTLELFADGTGLWLHTTAWHNTPSEITWGVNDDETHITFEFVHADRVYIYEYFMDGDRLFLITTDIIGGGTDGSINRRVARVFE